MASSIRNRRIRRCQFDPVLGVLELFTSIDGASQLKKEALSERHHRFEITIGFVKLEHRELGIVPGRDTLVAKVPIDLVDLFEPTYDQPLKVELGAIRKKRSIPSAL